MSTTPTVAKPSGLSSSSPSETNTTWTFVFNQDKIRFLYRQLSQVQVLTHKTKELKFYNETERIVYDIPATVKKIIIFWNHVDKAIEIPVDRLYWACFSTSLIPGLKELLHEGGFVTLSRIPQVAIYVEDQSGNKQRFAGKKFSDLDFQKALRAVLGTSIQNYLSNELGIDLVHPRGLTNPDPLTEPARPNSPNKSGIMARSKASREYDPPKEWVNDLPNDGSGDSVDTTSGGDPGVKLRTLYKDWYMYHALISDRWISLSTSVPPPNVLLDDYNMVCMLIRVRNNKLPLGNLSQAWPGDFSTKGLPHVTRPNRGRPFKTYRNGKWYYVTVALFYKAVGNEGLPEQGDAKSIPQNPFDDEVFLTISNRSEAIQNQGVPILMVDKNRPPNMAKEKLPQNLQHLMPDNYKLGQGDHLHHKISIAPKPVGISTTGESSIEAGPSPTGNPAREGGGDTQPKRPFYDLSTPEPEHKTSGLPSTPQNLTGIPAGTESKPPGRPTAPSNLLSKPPGRRTAPISVFSKPPGQPTAPSNLLSKPPGRRTAPISVFSKPPAQPTVPPNPLLNPLSTPVSSPAELNPPAPSSHRKEPPTSLFGNTSTFAQSANPGTTANNPQTGGGSDSTTAKPITPGKGDEKGDTSFGFGSSARRDRRSRSRSRSRERSRERRSKRSASPQFEPRRHLTEKEYQHFVGALDRLNAKVDNISIDLDTKFNKLTDKLDDLLAKFDKLNLNQHILQEDQEELSESYNNHAKVLRATKAHLVESDLRIQQLERAVRERSRSRSPRAIRKRSLLRSSPNEDLEELKRSASKRQD